MSYFDFDVVEEKPSSKKVGAPEKHPFSKLEVGESFNYSPDISVFTMRASAYQRGERLGCKFKVDAKTNTVERIS